ncbi:MAG: permease [Halobacteriaceae archaeon]
MSDDSPPTNVLFEWYERYIGSPEDESDVYVGFALFFGGISLGILGIVLFLWSATVSSPEFEYQLREIAASSGAVGLPTLLLGVTVLLPVRRRSMYAALAGTLVCVAGTALFVSAYPVNWNVPGPRDMSAQIVAVYAVGLVSVVAATGSSLVGHRVERAAVGGAAGAGGDDEEGETVTDEQVRRDIDEAMSNAELSWGGVEKRETKRLNLNTGSVDDVQTNVDRVSAKTTRASGSNVDDAVSGLRKLQGGEKDTASGSGVDQQTAALKELREQQRREAEREPDGFIARIRAWVNDLRGR